MRIKFFKQVAFFTIFVFFTYIVSSSFPQADDIESRGLALIKEGEALYDAFKYREAVEKFEKAKALLKTDKNLIRLYLNLSKALYALGLKSKTEKAIKEMFKRKLSPEIDEDQYPRGYLEIYNKLSKKYEKPVVSRYEIETKEKKVVEKPAKKRKKKKKFSPVIIILALVAVGAVVLLSGKKKDKTTPEPQVPTKGSINVQSSPSGAEVWLNGENTGQSTNTTLTNIDPGSHTVRLILDGYEYYETTVQVTAGQEASVSATLNNLGISIEWVRISSGSFEMGDNFSEGDADEQPVHTVNLDEYYISKYEITFSQYDNFCEASGRSKPSDNGWGRGSRPVINVSWHDAKAFCDWMSEKTGINYHLPTEAQWEKAARGDDQRRYPWGNDSPTRNRANYNNYNGKTMPVGSYPSGVSPYSVHDMAGNVYEWCHDWYSSTYYSSSPSNNPQGPGSGSRCILRSGNCYSGADGIRSASRYMNTPSTTHPGIGFRVCKEQ